MRRVLLMLFACAMAGSAAAQAYKWVDKDGRVRYGDTPPPGVKATPLRTPAGQKPPPPPPSADAAKKDAGAKDGAAKKDEKPLTPEQAFQKRQKERQEAEQKAEKERADADAKRQNCESAKSQLYTIQSGQRMTTTNAAGERSFMDDEQRQRALQQAQQAVNDWCK
jgi:hypothetical protein